MRAPRATPARDRRHEVAPGGRLAQRRPVRSGRRSPAASARRPPRSAPSVRSPAACPTPSRSDTWARGRSTDAGRRRRRRTRGCEAIRRGRCPSASAIMPVASAAAPPPVDPPALRLVFHGIARASEHLVERVAAGRELRTVGLAEDDRARVAQPLDDERVLVGHVVGVDRRAVRRPQRLRPASRP